MGQLQHRNAELVDLLSADFINCWIPIDQVVLAETVASVTFSGISQDFRTLVVSGQVRTSVVAESDIIRVRFNGDSGNNYNSVRADFYCIDTIATDCERSTASIQAGLCEGANSIASIYSPFIFRLPGYARTDRTKWLVLLQGGRVGNLGVDADMRISLSRGLWENLEPITSITVLPETGPKFVPGCIFELYGIL